MNIHMYAECPEDEEHLANFKRAGGDVICNGCGRKYYAHPYCPMAVTGVTPSMPFGYHWLHVLCDGSHVKL